MKHRLLCCFLLLISSAAARADSNALQDGDRVAIIGDSITEQKLYSVYMEDYLLMCQPKKDLQTMQFGWGGETSWGFFDRMKNDTLPYKPTVATTCYGMNDGGYGPLKPENLKKYIEFQDKIASGLKQGGVRFLVVGSPGAVDTTTFHVFNTPPEVYNKTLGQLAEAAHTIASENDAVFADVHAIMMDVMAKAKEKFGKDYQVAGPDGVHPGPNGHLIMAYAFLKALGCDGNLGEISVDLKSKQTTATDGHKVTSGDPSAIEIESTRYPFCFTDDNVQKISELFPFNQDLNRLTLKVTGADADKVKVTWGDESKTFDAKDLEKGINLAAEFPTNPFVEPFKKVEKLIRDQQNFETPAVKEIIHSLPRWKETMPEDADALEKIRADVMAKQQKLSDQARAAVVPVKHTIKIEVEK
jgi:lysophospholipase L1-like esterase